MIAPVYQLSIENKVNSLVGHKEVDEFRTDVIVVRVDCLDTLDLAVIAYDRSRFLIVDRSKLVLQVPSGRKLVLTGRDDHRGGMSSRGQSARKGTSNGKETSVGEDRVGAKENLGDSRHECVERRVGDEKGWDAMG